MSKVVWVMVCIYSIRLVVAATIGVTAKKLSS